MAQTDNELLMAADNNWIWAAVGGADPATDPAALLQEVFMGTIGEDQSYGNLRTSEIVPIQPFGSMVGAAQILYTGIWADAQGSVELMGAMWVGIRQDGIALAMTAETAPPEAFEENSVLWAPVINDTYANFAGID